MSGPLDTGKYVDLTAIMRAALEEIDNKKLYDSYSEWDDGYNAAWNICKEIAREALAAVEEASDE